MVPRDGAVVLTKESFVGPVFRIFGGRVKLVTQWSIMNPTTRLNMYNAYSSCKTTKDYKYNTYCIPKFSLVAKSTEHGANKGFFCLNHGAIAGHHGANNNRYGAVVYM